MSSDTKHEWKVGDEAMFDGARVTIAGPHFKWQGSTYVCADGSYGPRCVRADRLSRTPKLPTSGKVWAWLNSDGDISACAQTPGPNLRPIEIDIAEYLRNREIVEALKAGWTVQRPGCGPWFWVRPEGASTAAHASFDAATDEMLKLRKDSPNA